MSILPASSPRDNAPAPAFRPGAGGGLRSFFVGLIAVCALLASGLVTPGCAQEAGGAAREGGTGAPENGDVVTVTGTVTDSAGEAVAGVDVVLEATHRYFSLRHLERRNKDLRRVVTETAEDGSYRLEWRWDDWFNHLQLGAAVTVGSTDGGRRYHFLERVDLSRRLANGGSTVVPLVLDDTEFLEALRRFEATLQSEDQRRVYDELGYPDEVTVVELPDGDEASWWYFDRGEVYRFAGGELREVEPFEPVTRF